MGIQGRYGEAKFEMLRALEINPLSHNFLADLGQIYYFEGDYDSARKYCDQALEIYPDFPFAHDYLEKIFWLTGQHEAAINELVTAININTHSVAEARDTEKSLARNFPHFQDQYKRGGLKGFVESYIDNAERDTEVVRNPNAPYQYAWFYMIIGEKEKALDNLEEAFERKAFQMAWVKADPAFAKLHSEPRYLAILQKMNLGEP